MVYLSLGKEELLVQPATSLGCRMLHDLLDMASEVSVDKAPEKEESPAGQYAQTLNRVEPEHAQRLSFFPLPLLCARELATCAVTQYPLSGYRVIKILNLVS